MQIENGGLSLMTNTIDVCYFRVSKKDEKVQDLDAQIEVVLEKYGLKNPIIYKERGSAYKLEEVSNRVEFFNLLDLLFDASNKTIKDVFIGNIEKKEINLYVFGYDRIMRNLEFNMLFSLLQTVYGNKTFSLKEDHIITKQGGSSIERLTQLLLISISAQGSEYYSESISKNTKKAFKKINGSSFSKDGKKVGRQFTDSEGNKVKVSSNKEKEIIDLVLGKVDKYESMKFKGYYDLIIKAVIEKFNIKLSKAYITKLRGKDGINR